MHWMMSTATQEIAATAARMVVEEGLEYGPAKRRAVKQLGLPQRTALPSNDIIEAEVRIIWRCFVPTPNPKSCWRSDVWRRCGWSAWPNSDLI